jgi:hypothetical protein
MLAAVLVAAGAWLARAPWFRIAHVSVNLPLEAPVSRESVLAAAAIVPGANVWLIDPAAAVRRIEAIPYVQAAQLRRTQFPQPAVELDVTLRRPTACVRTAAGTVSIDATARVLQTDCVLAAAAWIDAGAATVPPPGGTIADPDLSRLLADAATLAGAGLSIRSVGRDRWGGLEAVDVTGLILRFGSDDDLARKAALVEPVRAGIGRSRPIKAIDLRAPETPTVEFR